jgi:PAS domain S-box-containing protein
MQVSGFALAQVDYLTNQVTLSPEAATLYGLPPDQLVITREQLQDTFHPEDRPQLKQLIQETIDPAGSGWFALDHRVISHNGEVKWLSVRKQIFFDRSSSPRRPSHAILVALDITERKRAEIERARLLQREQAAREAAENANRVKDEFLAILSHELRSPLNPILGWANLLQTKKLDADKTARALATIERNAKLQTQLIDDLLDVARILRGKLKLEKVLVDPVFVIESALETVQSAATDKQILIQTELLQVGQIRGDAGRLQQIVWNLLTNAVKFTPRGGRVEVRLELAKESEQESELQGDRTSGTRYQVSGTQNQLPPETSLPLKPETRNLLPNTQYAQITVSDTGMGIRQDFLPHIFESFRQEDTSVTRQFGGLGLGLAIVRYLVEAHEGTIAADSPGEGQGATFTVKLPLIGGEDPRAAINQPSTTDIDLTGVRVLAVDDNPDALELLTVALEQYGAEVQAVDDASEVVAALASFKPMVLLCDIGMPNMDGHALMQQIRALPPEQGGRVPAIAVTAYVREADHQKALKSGFQWHIAKPLDLEKSDTPGKAGGLMNVTAQRAGALPGDSGAVPRTGRSYPSYLALVYSVSPLPVRSQPWIRHSLLPKRIHR